MPTARAPGWLAEARRMWTAYPAKRRKRRRSRSVRAGLGGSPVSAGLCPARYQAGPGGSPVDSGGAARHPSQRAGSTGQAHVREQLCTEADSTHDTLKGVWAKVFLVPHESADMRCTELSMYRDAANGCSAVLNAVVTYRPKLILKVHNPPHKKRGWREAPPPKPSTRSISR